ncbi:MAG: hypothetical protein K0V04_20210 [Deltaproteobacteria bacterium]|nr:hypothetical protein [Deltaproteobacteria bacterium]
MTWCPGLRAADLSAGAAAPAAAPALAAVPTPEQAPAATPEAPAPEAEATPVAAPANDIGEVPELLELLRDYTRLQKSVLDVFRAKMGVSTGALGFLLHAPQVGRFMVPKQGGWVWRIDQQSVTLSKRKQVIELPLPTHDRDDAFEPGAAAAYIQSTGHPHVSHEGAIYPVEEQTIRDLVGQMARKREVKVWSTQPRPSYLVAS